MSEHVLASAADFRDDVKEEDCYEPAREVFLPKGKRWVLLRKPKPLAYTVLGAPLPGTSEEGAADTGRESISTEETVQVANWLTRLWSNVFVQPKLSLQADGVTSIHPDWIPEEDQQFIWRWIRGEVTDTGESVSTFPASAQG